MKINELILGLSEAVEEEYMVIKGRIGYRLDSDPTHTREDWEDVWTEDISRAYVFTRNTFRKFMKGFAYNDNRREVRSVPVQMVNGVPTLLPKKGMF